MKKLKSKFSELLWTMYAKTGGQLKCIKKFEQKSSSTTIYIHTEDEEENLDVYKCSTTSFNSKHIRRLFATDICIPGDLECGNGELIIWMHQLEVLISHLHTNITLNRIFFNCNWTSIKLGECRINNSLRLPDGSPVLIRINPVGNLPTVVVIPIPARTAEFANLFVILTIASWNVATPNLDMTENQRLVDPLAYMKANLGTYTGVSPINLLHETCNLYDLEFKQWTN